MKNLIENRSTTGHITAILTIILWGTTFVSTKILLVEFTPVEILFIRFVMGFLALFIVYPHINIPKNIKEELTFAAAGLCGMTLYYLLENIALTYTQASNVGVAVSVSPFFIAILLFFLSGGKERLSFNFIGGFLISMIGICMISFNGTELSLNPLGDMLAVLAAFVWAVYSIITKRIGRFGYNVIASTRKTFFYAIIFMIPVLFIFDFDPQLEYFRQPKYLFNIMFLGFGASAMCFVTWNFALKILGPVRTSVYIYMVPVVTVIASALILHERITLISGIGTVLTLAGLFLSQRKTVDDKADERTESER